MKVRGKWWLCERTLPIGQLASSSEVRLAVECRREWSVVQSTRRCVASRVRSHPAHTVLGLVRRQFAAQDLRRDERLQSKQQYITVHLRHLTSRHHDGVLGDSGFRYFLNNTRPKWWWISTELSTNNAYTHCSQYIQGCVWDNFRLRSYEKFPRVYTRTKRYCSFIQYALSHY